MFNCPETTEIPSFFSWKGVFSGAVKEKRGLGLCGIALSLMIWMCSASIRMIIVWGTWVG